MELRPFLAHLGHILGLSYGLAAVCLVGVISMTSAGYADEGEGSCLATVCAPQRAYSFASAPRLPPPPARPLFVLVASEEHASRVRSERFLEYYGTGFADTPATFIIIGTAQDGAAARAWVEADPDRVLIDLVQSVQ
jgi:hypothetical protein